MKPQPKFPLLPTTYCLLLLIILSLSLLTSHWTKPFIGHHDFNSNLWTLTAKNNLYRGLACTQLGQATTFQSVSDCPQPMSYYMNHPPLISWLLTLSYAIFGFTEWAGRLPLILVSTGSIILIYLIGTKLFNHSTGTTAALLALSTPMFLYFGKSINHEPLVLFGTLLATYSYINLTNPPNTKRFRFYALYFMLSSVWTGLSGWHGYLIFPLFLLHSLYRYLHPTKLNARRYTLNAIYLTLSSNLLLLLIFVAHHFHTCHLGDCSFQLINKLLERTSINNQTAITFTLPQFLHQQLSYTKAYYSPYLLILPIPYLLSIIHKAINNLQFTINHQCLIVLAVFGLSIPLIFSQQAFIHDYLLIYLLPFLTLSAAAIVTPSLSHLSNYLSHLNSLNSLTKRYLSAEASTKAGSLNAKRLLQYTLTLTLALTLYHTTTPFRTALLTSDHGQPHYQLASLINHLDPTKSGTVNILLESTNYYEFAYQYLTNYSYGTPHSSRTDTLASFLNHQSDLESRYTHLILITTNPVEPPLIDYLNQTYQQNIYGPHTVYTLPNSTNAPQAP